MRAADLTHGGFYRHFQSRDDLVTQSLERALAQGGEAMRGAIAPGPGAFAELIDRYLSPAHRDDVDSSCAVCTLANDVARSNEPNRSAYTAQVEDYTSLISSLIPGELTTEARRRQALSALALMVGAMAIARAVNDPKLSAEMLSSATQALKGVEA